ncbi:hypothetical protein D9613_011909 [Agrocybe pediades]|uniref:Nephrocystin 3-like N-terminal domain-containing protein n=1 Tax=Agrocybe pediades TaxID=84607 RepID=A0A8H4QFE9_9AGAR|nr:hypothetical protein D9613_011909 [Agrocybe pediades]
MISSSQLVISGGQFTQHNHHEQNPLFKTLQDAVAAKAFHDSAARFDPPKCHPGTRVKILDEIMGRIVGQGEDTPVKPFLWLNGAAGAGKSAIAQSTVEGCIERGFMVASFFFSKTDATRNHAGPLVATLAYQLYQAFPGTEVQTEIISALTKEPLIFTKQIQQQFITLVFQPLKTYLSRHKLPEPQTSFLIVIDGLDECIDRASQTAILSGLADSVRNSDPYIRIFVASRPEYDITQSFDSKHLKDIHTRLSLDLDKESDVKSDIKSYLYDQFEKIKDECNNSSIFWPKLDPSWPGEGVIEKLAWKSSGQFIYAATVIRYVTSARPRRPDRSLDMVLELRPHDGDHPFAELDALYEKILESCKNIEKVLEILSLKLSRGRGDHDESSETDDHDDEFYHGWGVPLLSAWEVSAYESVLSYEEGEVERLFCDLGALVTLSQSPGRFANSDPEAMYLTILHASLSDYLLDEARSKKFHIDLGGKYIGRHMANVLKYLASCGPDYDSLDWTGFCDQALASRAVTSFIDDSSELPWCTIPPELPQAAFSFPLKEFLAPHFLSIHVPYQALAFTTAFMHVLRIMAVKDPTCSYIEDHQHRNLDTVIIPALKRYFDNDGRALGLALSCHLGSHRFVPWCDMQSTFAALGNVLPDLTFSRILLTDADDFEYDDLGLNALWTMSYYALPVEERGFPSEDYSIYLDYMRGLLRRVSLPSPSVYAKATKVCFDALPLLPVPSFFWKRNAVAEDTKDDPCPHLVFLEAILPRPWMFRVPYWGLSDQNRINMESYDDEQSDSRYRGLHQPWQHGAPSM